MATWDAVAAAAPAFAAAARAFFDAHRHKTLATLRRDGSPRISGIEASSESSVLRSSEGVSKHLPKGMQGAG
jgi:hypothetical protein